MKRIFTAAGILALGVFQSLEASAADTVAPPSKQLVADFKLSPFYAKCVLIEGMPVVGSSKVSDYGLLEAAYLIRKQIGHRPDILHAMASNKVRFSIMAPLEMTTDIPEHSDLTPKEYWNRRARGLGATPHRPSVSCGEENLLCIKGDPYAAENIILHEFAHAIHEMGLNTVDPTFDKRLKKTFEDAKEKGLWKGTYAMQNRMEYWAEGAQSWFDTNRSNDHDHGTIDTRSELKEYDPDFAKLLAEIFGDTDWRYQRPAARPESERAHLAGFDVAKFEPFKWPESAPALGTAGEKLTLLSPEQIPSASPKVKSKASSITFANKRSDVVRVSWIDFDGKRKQTADVRPKVNHLLDTYAGHVFVISENGKDLGAVVATEKDGSVEIK